MGGVISRFALAGIVAEPSPDSIDASQQAELGESPCPAVYCAPPALASAAILLFTVDADQSAVDGSRIVWNALGGQRQLEDFFNRHIGGAIVKAILAAALTVGLATGVATGKECKGVSFPDQLQVEGHALALNGLGLRQATVFKVNVYVAALYVAKTSSDPVALLGSNEAKELILHFVRDVGSDDLKKAWDEGFEKNAKGELPAVKDRVATLNGWMTDIKTGQRLTFVYKPAAGVEVDVNGSPKGTIKGDDFAKVLFSIWLADPPNPEIKSGLLGGPCG